MGLDQFLLKKEKDGSTTEIMYWRKANQIHNFFTKDCEDDIYVEVDGHTVLELIELCKEVISHLGKQSLINRIINDREVLEYKDTHIAKEILPPIKGFFFGSLDIDKYYYQNLKDTVESLTNIDPDATYIYEASY
jgi:hypothetical protein